MSEKNKAGLNEVDMQAVVAAWIVASDGCFEPNGWGWVSCSGEGGFFEGTTCPLVSQLQTENMSAPVCDSNKRAVAAKDWLKKYHQQKAEAAETEKRKGEAAKKQEQEAKKICKDCRYTFDSILVRIGERDILPCKKKNSNVPACLEGCPDFEPRNTACQSPSVSRNDVADAVAQAERISQLEKENADLAFSVNCHEKKMEWAVEICESGECDAKKDRADLAAKCERLIEQRNKLANDFTKAMRRVKDVEVHCSLKTRLIYQLRKENAELRSKLEQAAEERKHLEEQLESKQTLPSPMYLYAMGVTAEEFLAMNGRCRQR